MKPNSRNSSSNIGSRQDAVGRRSWISLTACCLLLSAALTGCESLERKFTRKPKHPAAPGTPIIHFQDYTQAMTPVDRYRKHYLMFGYWNDELLATLQDAHPSPKRLKRSSTESLEELTTLRGLLSEEKAAMLGRFVEERVTLNEQLQGGDINQLRASILRRELESQTRLIQRDFFWRDVEDQLKQ